jgi:acetoin utilization deacetylase AcuC-like enzyme
MLSKTDSFSPSASKPAEVLKSWQQLNIPLQTHSYLPATVADLKLAHCHDYVDGIMAGKRMNGVENYDISVANSCLYTVGAMVAAARHALNSGSGGLVF